MNTLRASKCRFDERVALCHASLNVHGESTECDIKKIDQETYRIRWGHNIEDVKLQDIEEFPNPLMFCVDFQEIGPVVLVIPEIH
jgi:hypothetical protein